MPPTPPERLRRGKTLAERRQERHDALLDGALELFGTKGYHSTTVEEICRVSFVSTRNFYEEFDNREAVLIALAERIARDALRALVAVEVEVEPGPDFLHQQIEVRISALLEVLVVDPRVGRFVFIESLGVGPEQEARRRAVHRRIAGWLAEITLSGRPVDDHERERRTLQALAVVGACNELITDWVLRADRGTVADLADLLTDVVLDMIPRRLGRPPRR
jgi:AcrR family transcriptional regulator